MYLGLDFGTSGARAAVVDDNGQTLATANTPYDIHSCASWREALCELVASLPAVLRLGLRAILIDATSATVVLCDRENRPLSPPLLYHDTRAQSQAEQLRGIAPPQHVVTSATSSLAKLLWLSGEKVAYARAEYFLHQADWLTSLLSARTGISDYHNALKLGYDPAALAYPRWLLQLDFAHLLPKVMVPGEEIGTIAHTMAKYLGVNEHCRIHAGTTDSIAAFIASGAHEPGDAVTSLGSTMVLKLLSRNSIDNAEYGIYSHRLGDCWLVGGASNSGGTVLRQFFNDGDLARLSAEITPKEGSGLDYYPLPSRGERFPVNDPNLAPRLEPRPPSDALFLHGLLEGMARIEARGYALLRELGATPARRVLSAGGGAKNQTWQVIRMRHLRLPVAVAEHTDAAYGAARLARRERHSAID
ncbi:MAG: FGGY-family carbohydrate kinase [Pseudomonadota bacterium]